MLTPEQFDTDTALPNFDIFVEEFIYFGINLGPVKLPVSYDEQLKPLLHLGDLLPKNVVRNSLFNDSASTTIKLPKSNTAVDLIVTKRVYNTDNDNATVQARFSRIPLQIDQGNEKLGFRAVLLNPPDFLGRSISLINYEGKYFKIEPLKNSQNKVHIVKSDLSLTNNNPLKIINEFTDFLVFVKGGHCGFGNLFAHDQFGNISLQLLGFTRNDSIKPEINWFGASMLTMLPEIFLLFSKTVRNDVAREAIRQTINFYRASNASRSVSIEMSIIAAHSALEAIVNYILTAHAGWSKSLMTNRSISFSEKMRAATAYYGFSEDTLKHSPEIMKVSKERCLDEFSLISFFRNKLVHQDRDFVPTGVQLHEIWLIAQWLVEVLIFGIIGYRGDIEDRRVYNGWRGTKCAIPLDR